MLLAQETIKLRTPRPVSPFVNFRANKRALLGYQFRERRKYGVVVSFGVHFEEAYARHEGREFAGEISLQILACDFQLERVSVFPFVDAFVPAAIAEAGIGILKFELAIFGGGREHQRHDGGLGEIEFGIRLQHGKDVAIWFERQYQTGLTHCESEWNCGIAGVSADINRHITGRKVFSQLVYFGLGDDHPSFLRVQPVRQLDLAILGKVERSDLKAVGAYFGTEAKQVKEFS